MARGLHYSLRALGGTLGAQWERERRETLFLMVPVALSVLPHAAHLPWWVGAGFFVLFAWRLGLVMSGRWLPRASVRGRGWRTDRPTRSDAAGPIARRSPCCPKRKFPLMV